MTIQEFYDKLVSHDWYYAMSDDPSAYSRGRSNENYLKKLAGEIPGGLKLYWEFANSRNGKGPKPSRPPGMDDPMF